MADSEKADNKEPKQVEHHVDEKAIEEQLAQIPKELLELTKKQSAAETKPKTDAVATMDPVSAAQMEKADLLRKVEKKKLAESLAHITDPK